MSDQPPDGGGGGFFRGMFQRNTTVNAMAGSQIKIAGLEEATSQMRDLNTELKSLVTSLTGLTQQQAQLTSGISQTMKSIANTAGQTSSAVEGVTSSIGRFRSGAMSIASIFGNAVNSNFMKDLAMFPLRYITGATDQARNVSMGVSTSLGGQMYATGQTQEQLMRVLGTFPGGVQGGVEDIIGLQDIMRRSGAMMEGNDAFWGRGQRNPRTVGFLRGVAEMQAMTPGAPVAQLASTLGGYAGNVQAQQQSAYLTGGAFAMIGAGGRQKAPSEWAEGILRWLEGQRPGQDRGKGFTYGELLAQQFPGSNIDAWLSQQGVPQDMKDVFWNYALAKSRVTGATTTNVMPTPGGQGGGTQPFTVRPVNTGVGQGGNQAWSRLGAATAQSRGQFRLGSALTGMFSNKESANTWFNEMIAQLMADVIPKQIAGGSMAAMGVMPDPIQELLMTFLERSGTLGAALGGYIGYGTKGLEGLAAGPFRALFAGGLPAGAFDEGFLGAFGGNPAMSGLSDLPGALHNLGLELPDWAEGLFGGDVGDVGWTSRGTASTAGLHPTMRRGIERMMGDNPNIRVTSGLRDTVQQRRLRAAGNTNVSGMPSAHTRGLAADLGPRSQYNWIARNASRYGLKSGIGHGEPWHVGMPGIGDIGDPAPAVTPVTPAVNSGIGGLFDMFRTGVTKEMAISSIGTLMPSLLSLFLGILGTGTAGTDMSSIAYDPGLYAALRKAAAPTGIISIGGTYQNVFDTAASSDDDDDNDADGFLNPADLSNDGSMIEVPTGNYSPKSQEAGIAAARALYNSGFRTRDSLEKITAIAWRESGWDPTAENPNGEDKGLMQVNVKAHANRIRDLGYTNSDMLDIQKNANVAHKIFADSGNFMAWNYSNLSVQWGRPYRRGWAPADNEARGGGPADPLLGTAGSNAAGIVGAANIPNLGDVDALSHDTAAYSMDPTTYAPAMPVTSRDGRAIVFNNSFTINGGGQGGGIDVRRTVTLLADQLEATMRQRLARTN